MRLFGYLHIALEMNMLANTQLKKIMVPTSEVAPGDDGERAAPLRRPLPEEQALRRSCKNSVALACAVFSADENLTRQNIISRLAEPWREWFASQSHELSSCEASLAWELQQLRGAYLSRCRDVMRLLSSIQVLAGVGLRTTFLPNDAAVPLYDVAMQGRTTSHGMRRDSPRA